MKDFYFRFLQVLVWLAHQLFPMGEEPDGLIVFFSEVRFDGLIVKGDIREMKVEIGQIVDVTAAGKDRKGGAGNIQAGSAEFSIAATDAEGTDVSDQFTVTQDTADELKARIVHTGTSEATALVTLRADGDSDSDEEAEVVGTLALVYDAANVTAFEMTGVASDAPVV